MKTATLKPPSQTEREYTRLLTWYAKQIATDTRRIILPRLAAIKSQYDDTVKADGWGEDLIIALAQLLDLMLSNGGVVETRLPGIFALLAKSHDRQLIMAFKGATGKTLPPASVTGRSLIGVDVYRNEPWLAEMQTAWVKQNVSLVKSIASKNHDQLETIIRNGVFNGQSVKQISDQIQKQFDVTKNRATLIAQDQILGAHARLTQIRAESIGIDEYLWNSVHDSRVRPLHAAISGNKYSWKKPHPTEGHPGTPIRCRCSAALIFPDVD